MAEYIDREQLLNEFVDHEGKPFIGQKKVTVWSVRERINNAPKADVAQVVHGRWEPRKDVPGFVRCSACRNCNVYDDWIDGKKWAYCPNCGAKMDLEVENGKA